MDIPLLRMAEAYLIVAEASIRANNGVSTQETIDAMHEIRKRANAAESASYTLTDIRDEWAREFWFEGRRRIDLIRRRSHAYGFHEIGRASCRERV